MRIAVEIKNVKVNITRNGAQSGYVRGTDHTHYDNNSIFAGFSPVTFIYPGNNSISVTFNIVPVYNMYIYHFNGKEQYFHYNFTLKAVSRN